ncbi:MAG: hypothetical protein AB7U59_15250 [Desulfovibrionaceae bacterium]
MQQYIIYPLDGGGIAIICPCDCGLPVVEIAAKDVPAGVPYRIVDASEIPADRTFRAAWEADFSAPDGHGLGAEAWFAARQAAEEQQEAEA